MMKIIPSLVIFDLDDTMYDYEFCHGFAKAALIDYLSEMYGISRRDLSKSYETSRKLVKKRIQGASSHSRHVYVSELIQGRGIKPDPRVLVEAAERYWSEFLTHMTLSQGLSEFLTELRFLKIPIALVTDLTLEIQHRKLIHLGVDSFFDVIVASEETHLDKNSGKPFDLLIQRLRNKKLELVWFIGDKEFDFPETFPSENSRFIISPFSRMKETSRYEKIRDFRNLVSEIRKY